MATRSIAVLLAGLAVSMAPAAALAKPGDAAATRALARATNTLVNAARPDINRGVAAVKNFSNQIATQCPRAAWESPQNHDSEQLDNEVVGAMTAVGYRPAAAPIAAFARAVRGLHWSNGRLTRAVKTLATKLKGLSTLATPNLCGDIQAWVASSYATLPTSTIQFNERYSAVNPEAEEVPLIVNLATPYASPSEIPILHRVERFEAQLGEAEAHGVADYTHLMDSLGLNQ